MENAPDSIQDNYKRGYLVEETHPSDDESPLHKKYWIIVNGRNIAFYKNEKSEKQIKRLNLNRFSDVEKKNIYTENKEYRCSQLILTPSNTSKAKIIFVGPKYEIRDWFPCIKSAIDEHNEELKLIENSKLNPSAETFFSLNVSANEFVPKPSYSSSKRRGRKKEVEGIWYCLDDFYEVRKDSEIDDAELLVENVPYTVTKQMLNSLFAPHGAIKSINMKNIINGYVFITYKDVAFAERAKDVMHGFYVSGLNIKVKFARDNKKKVSKEGKKKGISKKIKKIEKCIELIEDNL